MSFNSFGFLLVFLPVCLIIYWSIRKKSDLSIWFLVLASLAFYGYSFPKALIILILSLVFNYMTAIEILRAKKSRLSLFVGVSVDVLLLAFFKYIHMLPLGEYVKLEAPGISFYTFCEIAFLVECYRKTITTISLREYAFLMTFFPKMIEGPIVRPQDILPQKNGRTKITGEEIFRGIALFVFGLFKKVVIAETLRKAVDYGFSSLDAMHSGEALIIMLSYSLQIYFDFSGYTDMALAIASFFGFNLPENFDSPYKSKDICDFWKRWHISLTTFFTRYIYIPLGGNRRGKARMYLNFFIVFMVSGLWHGAGFQFVVWGLMHGILFIITRMILDRKLSGQKYTDAVGKNEKHEGIIDYFWSIIKGFVTFVYVSAAWVFFRAPSMKDALHLFEDMAQCWFPRFNYGLAKCFNVDELWYVLKILHLDRFNNSIYILMAVILLGLCCLVFFGKKASAYARECKINLFNTLFITILFVWSFLSFEGVATYIYVNF